MSRPEPIVDPTNLKDMAIFAAACLLAKHVQYAAADAFHQPLGAEVTPVSLWAITSGAEKERWIRRAMELLKTFDPAPIPTRSYATGLRGVVIGEIFPEGEAS